MTRRTTLAGIGLAALAASAIAAGPATAATPKITVKGGIVFKQGVSVTDNQRFVGTTTAKPGQTVRIVNQASVPDPHSVSVVARRDLPKSFADLGKPIFARLMQAHGVTEGGPDGPPPPPTNPLVNVGSEGFGQAGDSLFFQGKRASLKIAADAKSGTTLHYLCLIHPWMQGQIKVRK